ncbi:unnamed protein product [Agarophyton chilense]
MNLRAVLVPVALIVVTCIAVRSFTEQRINSFYVPPSTRAAWFSGVNLRLPAMQNVHPVSVFGRSLATRETRQGSLVPRLHSYNVPAVQNEVFPDSMYSSHLNHFLSPRVPDHLRMGYETSDGGVTIPGKPRKYAMGNEFAMSSPNDPQMRQQLVPFIRSSGSVDLREGDVISLRADDGTYLKRYYPFPSGGHSGLLAYNDFVDPFSKFTVEIVDQTKIHLKADNGQYLKRFCCWRGNSVISMYLDQPDPYSVFTVEPESDSQIRLKAENGNYLKRVLYNDMGKNVIEARPVKDVFGIFTVDILERQEPGVKISDSLTIYSGDVITLEADDGTFLKRFYPFPYGGYSGLLAYQKSVDPFSKFTVEVVDETKIHLKAENGQYLKRFCCWRGNSVIAMYMDQPDPYSVFTVEPTGSGSSIRLQAENGKYLKRVLYNDLGKNVIEPRSVKDVFGIFKLSVV